MTVNINLDDNRYIDDIRRMTGQPDTEWLKMALAVYWQLLSLSSDSVVRIQLEDGRMASMGLTPEADQILRGT